MANPYDDNEDQETESAPTQNDFYEDEREEALLGHINDYTANDEE